MRESRVNSPTKVVAGVFGLAAFALAVVAGLGAGNPSTDVLLRALVSMAACYSIGLVLGMIGERTVDEHVREYIAARAVPDVPDHLPMPQIVAGTTGGKDGGKVLG